MNMKTDVLMILLKKCEEKIDRNGGFIMVVLLCLIVEVIWWAIRSDRPGDEIAIVLGAFLTPMIGLFKYVFELGKRK